MLKKLKGYQRSKQLEFRASCNKSCQKFHNSCKKSRIVQLWRRRCESVGPPHWVDGISRPGIRSEPSRRVKSNSAVRSVST